MELDTTADTFRDADGKQRTYSRECANCHYLYTGNKVVVQAGKKVVQPPGGYRADAYYVAAGDRTTASALCGVCATSKNNNTLL